MQRHDRSREETNELLGTLNRLRALESRTVLRDLPLRYRQVSIPQAKALITDWNKQIQLHEENISKGLEYQNKIILNKTEERLYQQNSRLREGEVPQYHVQYRNINRSDIPKYFPTGPEYDTEYAFVTDTETRFIDSISIATDSQKQPYFLATHSFPDSIPFIPDLKQIKQEKEIEEGERHKFDSVENISKEVNPSCHSGSTTTGSNSDKESTTPAIQLVGSTSPIDKLKRHLKRAILSPKTLAKALSKAARKGMATGTIKKRSDSENSDPDSISTIQTRDDQRIRELTEVVSKCVDNYMNTRTLRSGRIIMSQGRDVNVPSGSDGGSNLRMGELLREIEELKKMNSQPQRQTALTERDELNSLKNDMAQMAKMLQTMQGQVEQGRLTAEETLKLATLSGQGTMKAPTLIYKLQYPTNIIGIETVRQPLNILKPPAIVATIGTFDPDNNYKADFKETWERIQNYTRNHEIYEHEYIDILMVVMKGTAASCLNDIIRENDNNLKGILEAIQDIYVPQHTVYDDVDEFNRFSRPAGENIRTTVRRAGLIVFKLRHQCTPAAWPDRKYHMVLSLIKQVIAKPTVFHLKAKEAECALAGTQLDMSAIVNIIALHEQTHNLVPKIEMKLQYNINSMQIINHENTHDRELEDLKRELQEIKTLTLKEGQRHSNPEREKYRQRSASREFIKSPSHKPSQESYRNRDRERRERARTPDSEYRSQSRPPYSQRTQSSQRRMDGQRDYREKDSRSQSRENKSASQNYQNKSPNKETGKNYKDYRNYEKPGKANKSYAGKPNYDKKGYPKKNENTKEDHEYRNGKNFVTMNFYKMDALPEITRMGEGQSKSEEMGFHHLYA